MHYSRYTLCVEQSPDEYILFNTLTSAMVVVDREMKDYLDHLDEKRGAPHPDDVDKYLLELHDMRLLAFNKAEDDNWIRSWSLRARHDTSTLDMCIMTTFHCNFKCIYCVEEGVKDAVHMEHATAERTLGWVKDRLLSTGGRALRTNFYGGEPLLNMPVLEYLAREMSALTNRLGVTFQFNITTNGAMLTPSIVDRLVPYGLSAVKVTIDGDRAAHDARRPFLGGQGSFDRILNNITDVANKVPVMIGCNIDEENTVTIQGMLDAFKARGLDKTLYWINFTPTGRTLADTPVGYLRAGGVGQSEARGAGEPAADCVGGNGHNEQHLSMAVARQASIGDGRWEASQRRFLGYKDSPGNRGTARDEGGPTRSRPPLRHPRAGDGVCAYLTDCNAASVLIGLKKLVIDGGFRTNLTIEAGLCALKRAESFVIDPTGVIYKCPTQVGHQEFAIGHIDQQDLSDLYHTFVNLDVRNGCWECEFAPTCAGGCPYEAYLQHGSFHEAACHKDVLAEMAPATLRMQCAQMQ